MDGKTEGGGEGEVSPSAPSMPSRSFSSVPRQQLGEGGPPRACLGAIRRTALTSHVGAGPQWRLMARMPFCVAETR
jgi:hypothetical protein